MRRSYFLLVILLLAGCGDRNEGGSDAGVDLHAPRNSDERIAAARFADFVAALDRDDADAMCAYMSGSLAEDHACNTDRPRIPARLRGIRTADDLLVAVDPVPDDLQVSVRALGGGRLVGIFSERAPGNWRLIDLMVGSYG